MRITNKLNLPEPFVAAAKGDGRHAPKPKTYSVTQMLKGVRQVLLERRHADELEQDAADMVWAVFGTAVHSILEGGSETDSQIKEGFVSADMPDGYALTGIFDLYDDATGTVTDWKTASVWKAIYDEWDDYRRQLLAYCWILRQMGFEAKRGQIVALLKDHSKAKAKFDHTYPQHPVFVKEFDFTDEEVEACGEWLRGRFAEIAAAEGLPDDELPLCTDEERWAKPAKWAVMKKGRKTAVRLYDSESDASERAASENKGSDGPYYVEERPGTDGRCPDYCAAAPFCPYWRERYAGAQG